MSQEPALVDLEESLRASCQALVDRTPALTHLSLVTDGERRFTVTNGGQTSPRHDLVIEALVNTYIELHHALQVVRTGALIRLNVHTPNGAALIYTVPRSGHLVGICLSADTAVRAEADRVIADLATRTREQARLGAQNPGGWLTTDTGLRAPTAAAEPVVTGTGNRAVVNICRASVNEVLQYVLYVGDDGRSFAVDQFDSARHRRDYRALGDDLEAELRDLRREIFPLLGRGASTAVLDVEQGVVMMRWLPGNRRLFGVTLVQDYVNTAERMFVDLAAALAPVDQP